MIISAPRSPKAEGAYHIVYGAITKRRKKEKGGREDGKGKEEGEKKQTLSSYSYYLLAHSVMRYGACVVVIGLS